jgi:DNA-directed RNA polymerase specialized sigma subunit
MTAIDIVLQHNKLEGTVHIIELLLEGKTQKEISQELEVSQSWVSRVNKKYLKSKN